VPPGNRLREGRTGTEAILAVRTLFDHPIPGLILTGETDLQFLRECAGHNLVQTAGKA
jgi:two-component system, sensor histidine kinase